MRVALAFGLACLLGCANDTRSGSASQGASCDQDPWECPSGQTCWTADGQTAQCLPSGSGRAGTPCEPQAGKAACGDGLMCLRVPGWSSGECTAYCDSSHPCAASESCNLVGVQGSMISFSVCIPASAPDAGADAAATD